MSTRCLIAVAIPKNQLGKDVNLELTGRWRGALNEGLIGKNVTYTIPKNSKYISCYVHFDGYPDGVGKDFKKFTPQELFDQIILGDRSYFEDDFASNIDCCYINKDDDTMSTLPRFYKTIEEYKHELDDCEVDYLYLMSKNGKVYIFK